MASGRMARNIFLGIQYTAINLLILLQSSTSTSTCDLSNAQYVTRACFSKSWHADLQSLEPDRIYIIDFLELAILALKHKVSSTTVQSSTTRSSTKRVLIHSGPP